MKVKARTNIKYGTGWIMTGEVFDVKEADLPKLGDMVEAAGEKPAARPAPEKEEKIPEKEPEKPVAEKPKSGTTRRRKVSE